MILVFGSSIVLGQISIDGHPSSITSKKSIELIRKPDFNDDEIKQKSIGQSLSTKPIEFAEMIDVDFTPQNSGSWYEDIDKMIWRLDLQGEDASLLMAHFSEFKLPESARLYIFNEDQSFIIGAFSSLNNKSSGKLLTYPIAGNKMSIQLEVAKSEIDKIKLTLGSVGYGFIDIDNYFHDRKPLGSSGSCNVNSNCIDTLDMSDVKRSVCRIIIVRGSRAEFCTGTLMNNTSFDGTPYVLTAKHAMGSTSDAENSLFDFNYDSPYCLDIDGDIVQAISGAELVASFDSIDLAFVKLSVDLPASYRPYFAGWSREKPETNFNVAIHHPNGDNKKISFSESELYFDTYDQDYIKNGHWFVEEWKIGTTEGGSSGGGLFNENQQLIGTLTGGWAYCGSSYDDLYARFDVMWDRSSESSKQLKAWLDPIHSDKLQLDGFDPYVDLGLSCQPFSNFTIENQAMTYQSSGSNEYVTSSTNSIVDKIYETFTIDNEEYIQGISFGVLDANNRGYLTIEIISDSSVLADLEVSLLKIEGDAMNYIEFETPVKVDDDFSVQFSWDENAEITLYQSNFSDGVNHLFIESAGNVVEASSLVDGVEKGASLLLQITSCNDIQNSNPNFEIPEKLLFYPNPVSDVLNLVDGHLFSEIVIYDILGHVVYQSTTMNSVDCSILIPGIYLVAVNESGVIYHQRMIKN